MKGEAKPPLRPRLEAKQQALSAIVEAMAKRVQLDVQPVFETSLSQVAGALEAPMAVLHLFDDERKVLRSVQAHELDPVWARAWRSLSSEGQSPPVLAFVSGEALELTGDDAPRGLGAVVCQPVQGAEILLGTISVIWPEEQSPPQDPDRPGFLQTAAHLVGLSIEHAGLVAEMVDNMNQLMKLRDREEKRALELDELNQKLVQANRKLEELSITDGLTGLYNRRYFNQRLDEEVIRARRLGHPISLLMADLDHFKKVNDTLGHQAGDEALRRFAGWIKGGVREVDTVGRYGGEEFVVVLVNCDLQMGKKVAEKLRSTVEQESTAPPFDDHGGFTVSIGLAQLNGKMEAAELVNAADLAMYQAKEEGRNQVVTA